MVPMGSLNLQNLMCEQGQFRYLVGIENLITCILNGFWLKIVLQKNGRFEIMSNYLKKKCPTMVFFHIISTKTKILKKRPFFFKKT